MNDYSEMDVLAALGSILYFLTQDNYVGALRRFTDLCEAQRSQDHGSIKAVIMAEKSFTDFYNSKRTIPHAEQPPD